MRSRALGTRCRRGHESPEYQARNALFTEEIELRRHIIEHVAALRRRPSPGGGVPEDYSYEGFGKYALFLAASPAAGMRMVSAISSA
jgi:predicted dithiol-disulfide oxidoreductase (DUF899 family)